MKGGLGGHIFKKDSDHPADITHFRIGYLLINEFPGNLVLKFPEQRVDGTIVEVEGIPVDHGPLSQLLDGDLRIIHLHDHGAEGIPDRLPGTDHPQVGFFLSHQISLLEFFVTFWAFWVQVPHIRQNEWNLPLYIPWPCT